jgi:hypothetical protein
MQAVMTRHSDAHERVWSVKRNQVLPTRAGGYVDSNLFLDTVQAMQLDQAAQAQAAQVDALWQQLAQYVADRNMTQILATVTKITA